MGALDEEPGPGLEQRAEEDRIGEPGHGPVLDDTHATRPFTPRRTAERMPGSGWRQDIGTHVGTRPDKAFYSVRRRRGTDRAIALRSVFSTTSPAPSGERAG
ncbi:hypothetical protein GCM10019017_17690 [Streptomyces showdoensis]